MQLRPGQSEHLDLVVGYQGGNFFMNYHLELKLEMSVLGLVSVPRDCWSPPKPTLFIQKIQMTDKFLNPNLRELPAGWFTLCLQGFADGGIPCDLLVPIHSGVEVRYGRNLAIMACPEVDKVLNNNIEIVKITTLLSTVSCSSTQPAMARPSPPSVQLDETHVGTDDRMRIAPVGRYQPGHLLQIPPSPGVDKRHHYQSP